MCDESRDVGWIVRELSLVITDTFLAWPVTIWKPNDDNRWEGPTQTHKEP